VTFAKKTETPKTDYQPTIVGIGITADMTPCAIRKSCGPDTPQRENPGLECSKAAGLRAYNPAHLAANRSGLAGILLDS
jgi:hypothetical protein